MSRDLHGQCLCGAVEFSATPQAPTMGICHCSMCRRWSGGVFMAVSVGDTLKVSDESGALGRYDSSPWGARCFCKTCGSTLFWQTQDGKMAVVSAQAFDDPSQFELASEIFIDDQPGNYAFANKTTRMTGQEFIAQFMASSQAT
jgi:hypothetical protein